MDQKKAAEAIDQAAFRHSLGDVGKQARMPRLGFEVVSDADQAKHTVLQHSHFSKAKGKSLGEIPMPKKVIQSEVDREKTKTMISSHDKHPPIKVAKINGEHVVVDGHHRLAVAKALGKTKIKAELVESEMNEDDLLEGETPEERERRLKATRERLGTKEKKSSVGIKASYFLKHFQGKLPGRKVAVGDMNKESAEESCKGKKGMKTFKEYFEENLVAESEQLDEATITTVGGRLDIRPGTKYKHEVVKSHGIHNHETGDQHRVFTVKRPNGFHGVLVTNKDKTHVVGQTFNNHNKEDALKIADHYKKHGQIGMSKHDPWYVGGDKIISEAQSDGQGSD